MMLTSFLFQIHFRARWGTKSYVALLKRMAMFKRSCPDIQLPRTETQAKFTVVSRIL